MNKERLTKLAQHLLTVPPEKLKMHNWTCGTAACAVGHACAMPEFKAEGLALSHSNKYPVLTTIYASGWNAVEAFFDISYEAAQYLFSHEHYFVQPTPREVSERIAEFAGRADT